VTAIRKRQDEQRGKVDLTTDSTRKLEMRVAELLAAETERRQQVTILLLKNRLFQQVERGPHMERMAGSFFRFEKT
jgi:hypothetical protein